jgi:hypothetical protein
MGKVGVDRLSAGLATTGGGGGGGTPSGSDTEIQYNDNGAFGSDPAFIRKPNGFFTFQEGYGVLNAEVSFGNGDFTDEGLAIFAGGNLFFDDDANIFVLAGDLTELSGGKAALTRVQEGDDISAVFTAFDGVLLWHESSIESSTVFAGQTEVLLKFEGPTLTTEVSVNDNGIQILYDGVSAYTLPLADGTAGQVLSTDGAGVLDWVAAPVTLEASVTIASADVLQLNSTPITIVAAQGVGTAIEVISAVVHVNFNTTAYDAGTLLILSSGAPGFYQLIANDVLTATTEIYSTFSAVQGIQLGNLIENESIAVMANVSDPNLGDSDITVYITYRIITL